MNAETPNFARMERRLHDERDRLNALVPGRFDVADVMAIVRDELNAAPVVPPAVPRCPTCASDKRDVRYYREPRFTLHTPVRCNDAWHDGAQSAGPTPLRKELDDAIYDIADSYSTAAQFKDIADKIDALLAAASPAVPSTIRVGQTEMRDGVLVQSARRAADRTEGKP